ncbi:MAG: hydrogenase iron-sulfur subunit [Firmicutes bacterium]|nr:hydrogenase iron-sulfur subunit [Bacillota bacterium]
MNIAIVGQNPVNQFVEAELKAAGLTVSLIPDVFAIKSVQGESGDFAINAGTGVISAYWVIITQEPLLEKAFTGAPWANAPYHSLLDFSIPAKIPAHLKPMVILLDYPYESPAFMTKVALQKAAQLAEKKQQVLYLSKFMRTVGLELEALYREARLAGVAFLKYREIMVTYDETGNQLQLQVTGDSQILKVGPGVLLVADRLAMSPGLQKCAGLFRLKFSLQDGCVNGNEFFLYPTLTSRKGVSILRTVHGTGAHADSTAQIRAIITEIKSAGAETKNQDYAEVDAKKCAFCYTCYRACPHAAMIPDHANSAMRNLNQACYGCGICAAACPAAAIKITNRFVPAHQKTGASKSRGRLMLFCCENSAAIAVREIAARFREEFEQINAGSICCGGEFSLETLYLALQTHERVLVLTCMDGACKHFDGNRRAARLVLKAKEQLKAANLDENRVQHAGISAGLAGAARDLIKEQL